jgi:cation transporter-like permease
LSDPGLPSERPSFPPDRRRGYRKIAAVVALLLAVLAALIVFINEQTVNGLRHHLTLWLIIAIVMMINITSFLVLAALLAAYKWIKRDLDPDDEGD